MSYLTGQVNYTTLAEDTRRVLKDIDAAVLCDSRSHLVVRGTSPQALEKARAALEPLLCLMASSDRREYTLSGELAVCLWRLTYHTDEFKDGGRPMVEALGYPPLGLLVKGPVAGVGEVVNQ